MRPSLLLFAISVAILVSPAYHGMAATELDITAVVSPIKPDVKLILKPTSTSASISEKPANRFVIESKEDYFADVNILVEGLPADYRVEPIVLMVPYHLRNPLPVTLLAVQPEPQSGRRARQLYGEGATIEGDQRYAWLFELYQRVRADAMLRLRDLDGGAARVFGKADAQIFFTVLVAARKLGSEAYLSIDDRLERIAGFLEARLKDDAQTIERALRPHDSSQVGNVVKDVRLVEAKRLAKAWSSIASGQVPSEQSEPCDALNRFYNTLIDIPADRIARIEKNSPLMERSEQALEECIKAAARHKKAEVAKVVQARIRRNNKVLAKVVLRDGVPEVTRTSIERQARALKSISRGLGIR